MLWVQRGLSAVCWWQPHLRGAHLLLFVLGGHLSGGNFGIILSFFLLLIPPLLLPHPCQNCHHPLWPPPKYSMVCRTIGSREKCPISQLEANMNSESSSSDSPSPDAFSGLKVKNESLGPCLVIVFTMPRPLCFFFLLIALTVCFSLSASQ